jgi:hypothetical protein
MVRAPFRKWTFRKTTLSALMETAPVMTLFSMTVAELMEPPP